MRNLILFLVLISSLKCNNSSNEERKIAFNNIKSLEKYENDTVCYNNLKTLKTKDFQVISACHVVFSDSLSSKLINKYTSDRLDDFYNIDNEDTSNLNYNYLGDTILVKVLFMVKERNYEVKPDSIFYSNGILYLKEKHMPTINNVQSKKYFLEEMYYQIVFSKQKKPIIRHISQ